MKKFTHLTFYSENIYTSPEHTSCSKHHGSPLLEAKQKKMGSGWSNANTHTSIINLVHTVNKGSWRLINHNYSTLLSWFLFTQYTLLSWFWFTQYTLLPWTWFTQYTLLSWFWFTKPTREVNEHSKDVAQRPESPVTSLTWHVSKHKVNSQQS